VKLHAIEKFTTGFVYYERFLILVLFCEIWEFGHSFFIEQAITVISFGFNLQELNTLPGNKISNLYTDIFVFIFPINTCLNDEVCLVIVDTHATRALLQYLLGVRSLC
jgi:hypothetical protein